MAFKLLNRTRMSVSGAPGVGDVVVLGQTTGFQSFSAAGAADGDTFPYVIEDGSAWEIGLATYHSSGSFTRTAVTQSSAGGTTKIIASNAAIVYCGLRGQDVNGGVATLAALTDVDLTEGAPVDGFVLYWNNANGNFELKAPLMTLAAMTDVHLVGPFTLGDVLTWNGSYWDSEPPPASGGGGAGLYSPAMSTLPTRSRTGLTTWLNQGTSTVADSAVGVCLTGVGATNALSGLTTPAPATPYTVTALLEVTNLPTGYDGVGLGWYDGSSKLHMLHLYANNNVTTNPAKFLAVDKWSSPGSGGTNDYSSQSIHLADLHTPIWFQIEDDGTDVYFRFARDGVNFLTVFTVAKASGYLGSAGYNDLVLSVVPSSAAAPNIVTLMSWAVT